MAETHILTKKNEIVEIKVIGGIDTVSSGELEKTVSGYYHNAPKIILDFVDVPYISSAGLRMLLRADTEMGTGNFVLKNVNAEVMEVMNLTGLRNILTIQN